ncbi:Oidioi.mRNA.OKI2018_I69.chr1.g3647.t1.cds [Oikopleura dioica]|uniref:RNA methyltransferase n=1 Tax=Oikopleura dioica TaxID=34765 RepID=A0ABN7SUM6_OIKDI|nr:Oidioi.mRNA.OKI2018_I69.chr1.g3647.t1.cds [Oikopleura dioica]
MSQIKSRPRKRKVSNSENKEFPIGSVDDPLGLDSLSQDAIINDVEENEFSLPISEATDLKIPENLKDPLGLDDEESKKAPKKQRKGSKSGSQLKQNQKSSKKNGERGEKQTFPHGNYIQYYGYRNSDKFSDYRIDLMKKEWMEGLDVLDIGCNSGHLTLLIARDLKPRKIVGIDIDEKLIEMAQKNIRHYCAEEKKFPASFSKLYGPLRAPFVNTGLSNSKGKDFPENVHFINGNYVFSCDEYLERQEPEYDTIIAFSVSKWVHLNNGDNGIKRFFRRIFRQLRPGGRFLLEPQPWKSYARRKKLTSEIEENYKNIKFKPCEFTSFLTSIGFSDPINLTSALSAKGFKQRQVLLYNKPLNI